jgi:hypothetical protein
MGNFHVAMPLHEEDLTASRQALGSQHAETRTSIHNMAQLRCNMGDLPVGVTLMRGAVIGCRQTLGEGHPRTRLAVGDLHHKDRAGTARAGGQPPPPVRAPAAPRLPQTGSAPAAVLSIAPTSA